MEKILEELAMQYHDLAAFHRFMLMREVMGPAPDEQPYTGAVEEYTTYR